MIDMRFLIGLLALLLSVSVYAQNTVDPVAHYTFDDGTAADTTMGDRNGILSGNPASVCGVVGDALSFDGNNDFVRFPDNFSTIWDQNWTLSFYIKPEGGLGEQQLFSYTDDCGDIFFFEVTYTPGDRLLRVAYGDDIAGDISMSYNLPPIGCWYHIVIVREGRNQRLYVDNVQVDNAFNLLRIDFNNAGVFSVADGPCVGSLFTRFRGALDEVRLYNSVLSDFEISNLFVAPQTIVTQDTLIFLGGEVDVRVNENCTQSFAWIPANGVSNTNIAEPVLRPDTTTQYTLTFTEQGCTARDGLRVIVVDPDQVGCETIALPKAFTPNGDGLNDTYGLSNPFVIDELVAFRIWDRNGGLMFETTDAFSGWDGNYKGQLANPGTYLYSVVYICEGEEKRQQGTVVVLR
jgi:gliding motility-associated-like protein